MGFCIARPPRMSSKASIRHMRSTRFSELSSRNLIKSEMSVSGCEAPFTRRKIYSTRSDCGPPMNSSIFLSSHGRNLVSRTLSLRKKLTSMSILNSKSLGSDCTLSTISQSWELSANLAIMACGDVTSSILASLSSSSFGLASDPSLTRSLSSLVRSAFLSLFSSDSMRSISFPYSASRHALRFKHRSMRAFSLSRSSCFLCAAKVAAPPPPESLEAPYISSILASIWERQLTDLRSSSQDSSSSVFTLSAAFWEERHFPMMVSAPSSTRTLISCPQSFKPVRHVDAFQAASGSPNCAKPKDIAVPFSSRPRRNACTSPHCSRICCIWLSCKSGAMRVTRRKILGFFFRRC
mmetsp:Transcript_6195/g.15186  ORF Transcript_6195/g.15186 Transcript_6195/m.15186 type:complete len:351 (-) Transcript_6195:1198-2250(-)